MTRRRWSLRSPGGLCAEGAAELVAATGQRPASRAAAHGAVPPVGALAGLRVLVTRAREQADDLCRRLAAAGAVPVVVPMIRISPLTDTS